MIASKTKPVLAGLTILFIALLAFSPLNSWAGSLDLVAAKQQGLVGEKPDGTIGAVSSANADVAALISSVNAARMQTYRDIAARQGAAPEAVAKLAAKNLIDMTPSGQYYQSPDGQWVKKP